MKKCLVVTSTHASIWYKSITLMKCGVGISKVIFFLSNNLVIMGGYVLASGFRNLSCILIFSQRLYYEVIKL